MFVNIIDKKTLKILKR